MWWGLNSNLGLCFESSSILLFMLQRDKFYECPCFLVNMSNSYLVYQFQTYFLLRWSQGQPLPLLQLHFCLPFELPWATLYFEFFFFDKLSATCFINLFVFILYIVPLWEFSLNPSLASFTKSFFFYFCINWSFPGQTDTSPIIQRPWS